MSGEHSIETTKRLQRLVKLGFLHSSGGRGATYTLDGVEHVRVEDVFGVETFENQDVSLVHKELSLGHKELSLGHKELSLGHKELSLGHKELSLGHKELSSEDKLINVRRDAWGRLCNELLPLPVVDDENALSDEYKAVVYEIAKDARTKSRLNTQKMEITILDLCREQFFTINALASIIKRNPTALRKKYLTPLARKRKLLLAFPATPTHEKQSYRTNTELESSTKEIEND